MGVKVEKLDKNVVLLEIEVDAAKFDEAMNKSYLRNAKRFNVPGFRRGKAPRFIVEKYYGESVLYEDAINIACPEAYENAVKENNLEPVDRPEIDIKEIGSGRPLVFTAKVTVKPEVELGQYKGIEATKKEVIVTDDDVQKELERLQDKNSRLVTADNRPVQNGDTVIIDYEGFKDGVAFEGGKGEDYSLVIGSNTFIPGFEEQLIGMNAGEEKEINVTFPEEYHNEELKGQPATFKVKVKEIKFKELPVLDDEFAKDVSEFETLDELKADLRKKLTETAERKAKAELEEEIIKKVNENARVDIPRVMIDNRIDDIVQDFDMRLRYQGLDINKYLEYTNSTLEDFRKQFEERAMDEVKTQLVLEKIKNTENLVPTEQEVDEQIRKLAESYKQDLEEFKKHLHEDDIEYIKNNLALEKTIDFLVANAKIN